MAETTLPAPAPAISDAIRRVHLLRFQALAARALLDTFEAKDQSDTLVGVDYMVDELATQLQRLTVDLEAMDLRAVYTSSVGGASL